MSHWDVFNGDADGLCALQQLRLVHPREARQVTGLKRDIALLERVDARPGDTLTVLDISLARNRGALEALLARGVSVEYFDHHHAGPEPLPRHPALMLEIEAAPTRCTSLIVHRHLGGPHTAWAVTGAFGDGMLASARALGHAAGLDEARLDALRTLGEAINHNAYGDTRADVLIAPAALHALMRPYADPLAFWRLERVADALIVRQREDLARADALSPRWRLPAGAVYELPNEAWARRVQGSLAYRCAEREPEQACAVLRAAGPEAFVVTVRAPAHRPRGADLLCLAFGGGGRATAAGIDCLPRQRVDEFLLAFRHAFDPDASDRASPARPGG